jgi:hypothetical protein
MGRIVIFRRIVEEINQLNDSIMEKEFSNQDTGLDKKKKEALLTILRYAIDEKWKWTGRKSKAKILTFITSGCDYTETANCFNAKSVNSIEVTISNLGKKFEKVIGVHTIDLLLEGHVEEAMITARTGIGDIDLESYFLAGFTEFLPNTSQKKKALFKIEDCKKELLLFAHFTKHNVEKYLKGYSQEKLSYLINILTSTDKSVSVERQVLNQLFSGAYNEYKITGQIDRALKEIEHRSISRNLIKGGYKDVIR